MKKIILISVLIISAALANAQDACKNMVLLKEGASYTMKSYNHKDKLASTSKSTVKSAKNTDKGVEIIMNNVITDNKGKEVSNGEVGLRCEGNVMYLDLRSLMNSQSMAGFENMQIEVENNLMEIPVNLEAGSKLKDAHMKMTISNEGMKIATMDMHITNRMVEGKEKTTTEAGEFNTFKIKYDTEVITTTLFPMKMKGSSIDYFAPEIGTIRTESYDKNGKLTGYTVLTELKH
jgi:hypothetical protein